MEFLAERNFKNEECIKAKIVAAHRRGVCDSNGGSVRVAGTGGQRIFMAKPKIMGSVVKTYVYRNGRMVLKNG